jgi:hypothetical protein
MARTVLDREGLQELRELLLECFTPAEFRNFIEELEPLLIRELPGEGLSPTSLVHEGVGLLSRHNLIDTRLFERWTKKRHRRWHDVLAVARRMGVALSEDAGVATGGQGAQDDDLITLGPQIAILGRCTQEREDQWLISIQRFVRGDPAALARYISRFYYIYEEFQVVTSDLLGAGREITQAPSWVDGRLRIAVEQTPRRSFTTLTVGEDSDLVRPMRKLTGADATGYRLGLGLRMRIGEYAYGPQSGSILQQLLAEEHPAALRVKLIRAELLRLSVHGVSSIVWIGEVTILQESAEILGIECEIDDILDGIRRHRFTIKSSPPPGPLDIYNLDVPSDLLAMGFTGGMPRTDRVLTALQWCSGGTGDVAVKLADVRKQIGDEATDWNIRRAVEHLVRRTDIIAADFEERSGEVWIKLKTTWGF